MLPYRKQSTRVWTTSPAVEWWLRLGYRMTLGMTLNTPSFFRKNVDLKASVIPDPGVDFRDAVKLIEHGQFNTDGIFTHVLPLAEVQSAFAVASSYTDGVVKLVIEFPEDFW